MIFSTSVKIASCTALMTRSARLFAAAFFSLESLGFTAILFKVAFSPIKYDCRLASLLRSSIKRPLPYVEVICDTVLIVLIFFTMLINNKLKNK